MLGIPGPLGTLVDLLVVVFGFGLIVFVHELGHFLAARWAGIRVLAFAVGFGPAVFSYRKGLGLRRGSSEEAYRRQLRHRGVGGPGDGGPADGRPGGGGPGGLISPTEYRLNVLPLGGYVKMLGQDDLDPSAVSDAADSYQNCVPWKRMVVISAGVVMNMISAAALFVLVFMVGMRVEPPVIGTVAPDSPAARATGAGDAGLRPGDVVLEIGGWVPTSFNDVVIQGAIAEKGRAIDVRVLRDGAELTYALTPEVNEQTGLLDLGISPARTTTLLSARSDEARAEWAKVARTLGIGGVRDGMTLTRAGGRPVARLADLQTAVDASGGEPIDLVFRDDAGEVVVAYRPAPEFERGLTALSTGGEMVIEHVLGLTGLMRVAEDGQPADDPGRQGLRPGDVLVRVGDVLWPGVADGIEAIRSRSGQPIDLTVQRDGERVRLTPRVKRSGQIGFGVDSTSGGLSRVSLPRARLKALGAPGVEAPPAARLIDRPGTRIVSVGGVDTGTLAEVRGALLAYTRASHEAGEPCPVPVELELPLVGEGGPGPVVTKTWVLSPAELDRLHALGWEAPNLRQLFEPQLTLDKAEGPVDAIVRGVKRTHIVMLQTYLTFARLFQGSVKVEHLKGPVGIAHIGTKVAERGFIWVLFFMALISVNLAVINFLPLPIVDGGQFLMLVYEQIRGRPVPIPIQNAVTMAGLLLIGAVFLIVTFNDVKAILFGL